MAKLVTDVLKIDYAGIYFDLNLRAPIVAVTGDSGTGKSLLSSVIQQNAVMNPESKFVCINYLTRPDMIKLLISQYHDKVIVIDNADVLLPKAGIDAKYIQEDSSNQYLIFTRVWKQYGVELKYTGEFISDGNTVRLEYTLD